MTALAAPAIASRYLPAVSGGVDRAIRVSTAAVVLAVAGIAAYISYWHAYAAVREYGETGVTARLEPGTTIRARKGRRHRAHQRPSSNRRTRMTSQLSAALRAAAAGLLPDEAGTGLIISHGTFLHRDFTRLVETASCISDGTQMAWIDWGAVVTALDTGLLPASGGEKRILRVAASLAAGHPVSLREAIPGLDQRALRLVTAAIGHAAGQRS